MKNFTSSEKPWYFSSLTAFIGEDCPRLTGQSPQLFVCDISTLTKRLASEGESFLTKTLPQLGKAIDLALQGHVPLVTAAFAKRGRTSLPKFLWALTRHVFSETGWVRNNAPILHIRLIRQVCNWFKKLKKGYSDESLQSATVDFINIDRSLPPLDHNFRGEAIGVGRAVLESVLKNMPALRTCTPKHGPGAVSNYDGVDKRQLRVRYSDLERVFRPIPWMRSLRDVVEDLDEFLNRPVEQYGLSAMRFVEKDSSGPRIIGLEPAEYMWCQQAIKSLLYDHIETRSIAKGQVNFTDQSVNRELARNWADWETLDMSKASDRNSFALVRSLFSGTAIWPALQASRTPGTVLPDGSVLMYRKFAPMGSAVCFPVEALVFYCLAVAGLHLFGKYPLQLALRNVFVYGDDLIVPRGAFKYLSPLFAKYSLVFNEAKCCTHGKFRESCGMDAFDGEDVTPLRAKNVVLRDGEFDVTALAAVVAHQQQLCRKGYWAASLAWRDSAVDSSKILRKLRLPTYVPSEIPVLHWEDAGCLNEPRVIWKHFISHVRGWVLVPINDELPNAVEARCLRESLSLSGPVGITPKGRERRYVARRFVARLRKRTLPSE